MNAPLAIIGISEILIIVGVLVLLFGASKLPVLMKGFGQGIQEFKKAVKDETKP